MSTRVESVVNLAQGDTWDTVITTQLRSSAVRYDISLLMIAHSSLLSYSEQVASHVEANSRLWKHSGIQYVYLGIRLIIQQD